MKEFLKSLGLEDEVISKIIAKTDESNEEKENKYNELVKEKETLTEQLRNTENSMKELKNNVKDVEVYQNQIAELESKNETLASEFTSHKQNTLLDGALAKAGVKNNKAFKALLDNDIIKYENDAIVGLDEQLAKIKETDSYLFNAEETAEQKSETMQQVLKSAQALGRTENNNERKGNLASLFNFNKLREVKES